MTYRLLAVEVAAHVLHDGRPCADRRCGQCRPPATFKLPVAGSALIVPPPPDYSTPAAVTKRC